MAVNRAVSSRLASVSPVRPNSEAAGAAASERLRPGVSHDSDDREVDGASGLRHGGCLGATIAAASRKAGSLPDAGQGIGGECVGLFGR